MSARELLIEALVPQVGISGLNPTDGNPNGEGMRGVVIGTGKGVRLRSQLVDVDLISTHENRLGDELAALVRAGSVRCTLDGVAVTAANLEAGTGVLDETIIETGAGAVAGTGVTAVEKSSSVREVVLTLVDTPVPLVDEAGVVAYGSLKVYDLPEGVIVFLGATANLALTKSSAGVNDTWDGDIALGTVAANNGAALATTEQDLIPTTATPQAVAGVTTGDMKCTSTEACKVFDGTSTPKDVFLNIVVDDADHDVTGTPCNIIVNGTIRLMYANLGDV